MPDREEMEKLLEHYVDYDEMDFEKVLLNRDQLHTIRQMFERGDGLEKVNKFLEKIGKGGENE